MEKNNLENCIDDDKEIIDFEKELELREIITKIENFKLNTNTKRNKFDNKIKKEIRYIKELIKEYKSFYGKYNEVSNLEKDFNNYLTNKNLYSI
jgi:predicted transcriptional regulator